MTKNKTYRFAFGSSDFPASPVWQIVSVTKKGDIYISSVAPMMNNVHISLHASGASHFKIDTERDVFPGPVPVGNKLLAFRIVYRPIERNLRAQVGEENKEVVWLGLPKPLHFFVLEFYYCESRLSNDDLLPHERAVFTNIPAIFRGRALFMNVVLAHVQYSMENLFQISQVPTHDIVICFENELPPNFESSCGLSLFSVSVRDGVPTYIEESFRARAALNPE